MPDTFAITIGSIIVFTVVAAFIRGKVKDKCLVTLEFIEIMDVDYKIKEDQAARKADIAIPRKYGVVRHLGE